MIQVAVDPKMGFTRKKLSSFDFPPHPDWDFLKHEILGNVKNIPRLFFDPWMKEVTANLENAEKENLEEHLKIYFPSEAFNLVSCDRYSREGHQGSKVIATTPCSRGKKIKGLVGTTCPIGDYLERELARREVDSSCILKASRSDFCHQNYIYKERHIPT